MAGIPIVLVLKQPDLGTAIIMLIVLLIMLAVAGLPLRILVMLLLGVARGGGGGHQGRAPALLPDRPPDHVLAPQQHQQEPVRADAIYNLTQAKTAIGSGGLFGVGAPARRADQPGLRARAADRLHLHRGGGAAGLRRRGRAAGPARA